MSSANSPLPTPRDMITSLLTTLFTTTPQPAPTNAEATNPPHSEILTQKMRNPLKSLSASRRALLTTLHVLFAPPMLLQALDLLDQGLVTRIVERPEAIATNPEGQPTEQGEGIEVMPLQANINLHSSAPPQVMWPRDQEPEKKKNVIYQVCSSQPPKSRVKDASGVAGGGNIYSVYLEAWGCSCAAFAFGAFPSHATTLTPAPWSSAALYSNSEGRMDLDEQYVERAKQWEFGGLSVDGRGGKERGGWCSNVPICKHLLACLLGEKWDGILGGYIKMREVGREEMAGLECEG